MINKFVDVEGFYEYVQNFIVNHSTVLIKIPNELNTKAKVKVIGSGTFIRLLKSFGVLTAKHVAKELSIDEKLGFNILPEGQSHNFNIPVKEIEIMDLSDNGNKPDISFIKIPNYYKGTIEAYKSFFDLCLVQRNYKNIFSKIEKCNRFATFGIIEQNMSDEEGEKGFDRIKKIESKCLFTSSQNYYYKDGCDYIELDIDFDKSTNLSQSLAGMSGGGIWFIPHKQENKMILLFDIVYSGLNIEQTSININRHKKLIGHCYKSIYENAYKKL